MASNYDANVCFLISSGKLVTTSKPLTQQEALMKRKAKEISEAEELFVGIDLHKRRWHITIRTHDLEFFSASIAGNWEALSKILNRYKKARIHAVYEAGYFGFWLFDKLTEHGINCIVTPPTLIPQEYGNRVKTDRLDSRKLARFLAKGLLNQIYVPSREERFHRQVLRRRRQIVRDRVRVQNRIKAELNFYGIDLPSPRGKWTQIYFDNLCKIKFRNKWMQESFNRLLEQYDFLCSQIVKQTNLLKKLAQSALYRERVEILCSIPGIGIIGSMEILLELQNVSRFKRADQLAAYVGLTPSQFSSSDKIRMGRITGMGKHSVRTALVESCWWLISKDKAMRRKYESIKARAGSKRAIVAIARHLLLCIRRMLLDNQPYRFQPVT
jgi:transposase